MISLEEKTKYISNTRTRTKAKRDYHISLFNKNLRGYTGDGKRPQALQDVAQ